MTQAKRLSSVLLKLGHQTVRHFFLLNQLKWRKARLKMRVAKVRDREAPLILKSERAIEQSSDRIWETVTENKALLLKEGMRSFATIYAIFRFRRVPTQIRITDPDAIMEIARRRRVASQVGIAPSRAHVFDRAMFLRYIKTDPEFYKAVAPYIEEVPAHDVLLVTPNEVMPDSFNQDRITPEPFSIKGGPVEEK